MMSDNRNEIIRESIDRIEATDATESRMLAHIYSKAAKQKQQDQPVIRRNNFNNIMRWVMPATACLLILAVVMVLPNHIKGMGTSQTLGTDSNVQIPNPYETVEGSSEFEKRLGIILDAPQNAENVIYSIINGQMADIGFTYSEHEYKLRGSTQESDISGLYGEEVSSEMLDTENNAIMTVLKSGQDTYITISWEKESVYFNLSNTDGASIEEVSAIYDLNK